MKTSDLCKQCQLKVPILDFDAVVMLIREVIDTAAHVDTSHDAYLWLQKAARLAHKAAGSTMKEE